MHRSELTVDLGALRRNVATLRRVLGPTELWAVVKADGYGHGARDVARAALEAGASALCVATVAEGLALRREHSEARILVMGPAEPAEAREARLELTIADGRIPEGIGSHVKLDTGMGRYGLAELPAPPAQVVGLMTHLATADTDPAFAERQVERFLEATAPYAHLTRHAANSGSPRPASTPPAAGSRSTASRLSAPTRPTTGSSLCFAGKPGWRRSSGSSRARARGTGDDSWPSDRPGSASSRSATRTASAAT